MPILRYRRACLCRPRFMSQEASKVSDNSQPQKVSQTYRLPASTTVEDAYAHHITEMVSHNRYTTYPGAAIRKDVKPPKRLIEAAITLSKKYPVKNVVAEAKKLQQYLWSRRAPPEETAVRKTAQEIEHRLIYAKLQKADDDMLTPEELEKVQHKALEKTKKATYHWKPVDLDAYLSVVYMSSQLVSNYAVLYSIMHEIALTDPDFKPTSMLDFGSGLATSVWAVNEVWNTVKEHLCWDKSAHVSTLARLLLQDGKDFADMMYPGVYFRQQFDKREAEQSAGFDLVVSSYSLFELPNQRSRLNHIDRLWTQANNYLILAENGTVHGHRLIEEARMHILKNYKDEHKGNVAAPCPHNEPCEMVNKWSMRPCNFEITHRLGKGAGRSAFFQRETSTQQTKHAPKKTSTRYSYVVIKKGELPEKNRYPRILAPPHMSGQKCVQCLMCLPDGKISQINVHGSIVKNQVFKLAKSSVWGTRLPITHWENLEPTTKRVYDPDSVDSSTDSAVNEDGIETESNTETVNDIVVSHLSTDGSELCSCDSKDHET